jgi:hypothetical protein
VKVADLEGALLDAWVVKALGGYRGPYQLVKDGRPEKNCLIFPDGVPFRATTGNLMPSSDWSHGGPIIERERIRLHHRSDGIPWASQIFVDGNSVMPIYGYGDTPLIAAMRAYVASKYGVEVPDE